MAIIVFQCTNADCNRTIKLKEDLAGKRIKCPSCGQKLKVPRESTAPKPAEEQPVVEVAPPLSGDSYRGDPRDEVAKEMLAAEVPQPEIKEPVTAPATEPIINAAVGDVSPPLMLIKAKRQQYAFYCPRCTGVLLQPGAGVDRMVCHHCSAHIELV